MEQQRRFLSSRFWKFKLSAIDLISELEQLRICFTDFFRRPRCSFSSKASLILFHLLYPKRSSCFFNSSRSSNFHLLMEIKFMSLICFGCLKLGSIIAFGQKQPKNWFFSIFSKRFAELQLSFSPWNRFAQLSKYSFKNMN